MLIQASIGIGVLLAIVLFATKIYERRQDVLYGPYIQRDDDTPLGCV